MADRWSGLSLTALPPSFSCCTSHQHSQIPSCILCPCHCIVLAEQLAKPGGQSSCRPCKRRQPASMPINWLFTADDNRHNQKQAFHQHRIPV